MDVMGGCCGVSSVINADMTSSPAEFKECCNRCAQSIHSIAAAVIDEDGRITLLCLSCAPEGIDLEVCLDQIPAIDSCRRCGYSPSVPTRRWIVCYSCCAPDRTIAFCQACFEERSNLCPTGVHVLVCILQAIHSIPEGLTMSEGIEMSEYASDEEVDEWDEAWGGVGVSLIEVEQHQPSSAVSEPEDARYLP